MTAEQIIFLVVALFTLGSGFMVVTTRNLVHAALWLVSTLFGVAVTYALLNASFLAVVQVVVYIGAIAILFIFAVMLTRKDMRDQGPQMNRNWWVGALLAVLTFGGLFFLLQSWSGMSKLAADIPSGFDAVDRVGQRADLARRASSCHSKWHPCCCWRRWWARSTSRSTGNRRRT